MLNRNPISDALGHPLVSAPSSVHYIPNFVTPDESLALLRAVETAPLPKWTTLKRRRLQSWGPQPDTNGSRPSLPEPLPVWLTPLADRLSAMGIFVVDEAGADGAPERRRTECNNCLINEYKPGQGIMPHEDGPAYLPCVATVSLGERTVLDFYRQRDDDAARTADDRVSTSTGRTAGTTTRVKEFSLVLQPLSLLILQEDAYLRYLHGIDEVDVDVVDRRQVANWDLAMTWPDENAAVERVEGEDMYRMERKGTRVSLTFRTVRRVSKIDLLAGLFGGRAGRR